MQRWHLLLNGAAKFLQNVAMTRSPQGPRQGDLARPLRIVDE
jgi:hypothetical protein